ncbi:MAG TPA: kelch repeat-containing protein, partial [Labilithrix sp.]|nr:kelch repeat-containing protein [Labilithrix sp.]
MTSSVVQISLPAIATESARGSHLPIESNQMPLRRILAVGACVTFATHLGAPSTGARQSLRETAEPATALADVVLPAFANGSVSVREPASQLSVRFTLRDAQGVAIDMGGGGVARYERAFRGNDLIHRVSTTGTEDFVLFATRPSLPNREELVYDVDVSHVAGVRLVARTLELVDEGGAPRLRVPQPYVVDAFGVRHDGDLALNGCAHDESPAPPWDRAVTRPGASQCELRVSWASDLAYPLMVDPAWTSTGSMIVPRQGHTATLFTGNKAGLVYIAGGTVAGGAATATAELYDPKTGTFAATNAMPVARRFHTAILINGGGVLIIGGVGDAGALATAHVYSPVFKSYGPEQALTTARSSAAAVVLPSNKILIVGGADADGNALASAELYEPTTGLFTPTTSPMNATRSAPTVSLLASGKVLVVGGSGGAPLGAEVFDPASGTFAPTGSLARVSGAAVGHTATVLPSGKVLVTGGELGVTSADLYDPASGTFTATGPMATARSLHGASLLASGKVLLTGGIASMTDTATTEIYDPATGTFTPAATMSQARSSHAATTLLSGQVFVTGGVSAGVETAKSELLFDGIGGPCATGDVCPSGVCSDGICCAHACGSCMTCEKTTGRCVAVTGRDHDSCTGTRTCGVGGECKLKRSQPCSADDECAGFVCADGFCCAGRCDGVCESCGLPGKEGTCSLSPAGSAPRAGSSCAPYVCSGKGLG